MDTPLTSRTIWRKRRATIVRVGAGLALLAGAGFTIHAALGPSLNAADVRIAQVRRGDIATTVNASGVVMPLHEEQVTSPVASRVAKVHAKLGQTVAAGTLLLELDDHATRLAYDSIKEQLAQQENRIESLGLELEQKRKQLRSQIELLELDLESARVKRERYTTLRRAGGVSGEDMLAAELNVKRVEIELRQRRELIEDSRRATNTSIEGARLQKSILQKQLAQQQALLDRARVTAPFAGVLTMLAHEEGASVATGQLLARVSEPNNFRIEATVSDYHARSLAPGQPVRVAQGKDILAGHVDTVLPEIQDGSVKLLIALDQPNHPLLHNKMRVDVGIVTEKKQNRLVVDTGAAFNGQGRQAVYLVRGGVAQQAMLNIGGGDGKAVEIIDGAAAGDRVIVSDTSTFRQHASISIKQ